MYSLKQELSKSEFCTLQNEQRDELGVLRGFVNHWRVLQTL